MWFLVETEYVDGPKNKFVASGTSLADTFERAFKTSRIKGLSACGDYYRESRDVLVQPIYADPEEVRWGNPSDVIGAHVITRRHDQGTDSGI